MYVGLAVHPTPTTLLMVLLRRCSVPVDHGSRLDYSSNLFFRFFETRRNFAIFSVQLRLPPRSFLDADGGGALRPLPRKLQLTWIDIDCKCGWFAEGLAAVPNVLTGLLQLSLVLSCLPTPSDQLFFWIRR